MERAIPILPADDIGAAMDFYSSKLGFEVRFEVSEDGKNGLLGVGRGAIWLTLDSPMAGHGRNACVSLEVDDADAYFAECSPKVNVLRPPRTRRMGRAHVRPDRSVRQHDLRDGSGEVDRNGDGLC
jgi:hypothetical protein